MAEEKKDLFQSYKGLLLHFGKHSKTQSIEAFLELLREKKINYYFIDDQQFDFKIGQLIGLLENQKTHPENYILSEDIDENILFFSGFSRSEMEDFLALLRDDKYPRFELKAVATKTNQDFSFTKLLKELRQDRMVISHVITLRNGINSIQKKLPNLRDLDLKNEIEGELKEIEHLLVDIDTTFNLALFREKILRLKDYHKRIS